MALEELTRLVANHLRRKGLWSGVYRWAYCSRSASNKSRAKQIALLGLGRAVGLNGSLGANPSQFRPSLNLNVVASKCTANLNDSKPPATLHEFSSTLSKKCDYPYAAPHLDVLHQFPVAIAGRLHRTAAFRLLRRQPVVSSSVEPAALTQVASREGFLILSHPVLSTANASIFAK